MIRKALTFLPLALLAWQSPAFAEDESNESGTQEQAVSFKPILDVRLRYEHAEQDSRPQSADALTLRARAGGTASWQNFTLLAEGEGTLAISDSYNDTIPGNGVEPFPVVADPDNLEVNRLQIGYRDQDFALTLGRQRIIHDNARFLGNVGWRQNEQTFDAVRAEANVGPVNIDVTYANSQRTIFGSDSPNEEFEGDLFLARGSIDGGNVKVGAFSYLIDYDTRAAFSSQTYGVDASVSFDLGEVKMKGRASYATQSDYGDAPVAYQADYTVVELGGSIDNFSLTAGQEVLGSDDGNAAFQTPLATGHKFNGWSDQFLATPAAGLKDTYFKASVKIPTNIVQGLRATVAYHSFESEFGSTDYGSEIDAVVSFKVGDLALGVKYANYNADGFGTDTERFWLQVGFKL